VDCSVGDGSGVQPAVRLRRQLHLTPRTRLRRTGEPLHERTVLPLQGNCTTSPPTRFRRWLPSSASTRDSWGC
jgi:hypothetical protein